MRSNAIKTFIQNEKDVAELWDIHEEISGFGPGRKYGVDVINRSAIVFITACWESFVEDLATEAFDFMVSKARDASVIPSKVRDLATKEIFDQRDSRKVWGLADAGWRAILVTHRTDVLGRWVEKLNTPKTAQVNDLFESMIGLSRVSSKWHWNGMSSVQSENKLDKFITIRGNIAHRTEHNATVYKNWITNYLGHVENLVMKTEAAVINHLNTITGSMPW